MSEEAAFALKVMVPAGVRLRRKFGTTDTINGTGIPPPLAGKLTGLTTTMRCAIAPVKTVELQDERAFTPSPL